MLQPLLHDLMTVRAAPMTVRTTALLLAPVWLGLAGGAIAGRPLDGLLVALGGYVTLFGTGHPAGPRLRIHLFASVGMLSCVAVGMMAATAVGWTLLRT